MHPVQNKEEAYGGARGLAEVDDGADTDDSIKDIGTGRAIRRDAIVKKRLKVAQATSPPHLAHTPSPCLPPPSLTRARHRHRQRRRVAVATCPSPSARGTRGGARRASSPSLGAFHPMMIRNLTPLWRKMRAIVCTPSLVITPKSAPEPEPSSAPYSPLQPLAAPYSPLQPLNLMVAG